MKSAIHSIFKTFILSVLMIAQVHFAFAQTAAILPPAKTTFVDQNGKPLASGTVEFYIPGQSTHKTTWQDAAETIPNTNPVVLDPSGRAIILGSGSYRQVVKDKLHNLIWDQVTASAGSGGSVTTATGDGDLVGTIKPWAGLAAPNQYLFTYGQEVSRVTYAVLFTAITSSQAAFCSTGSAVLTGLSDTTNFWVGMSVELSCLAAGHSTVVSKTSTTVTLAANSNVTLNTTAVFFPWGNGNSVTTFNLPDFRGQTLTGNNNMGGTASSNLTSTYFGPAGPNSAGAPGGSEKETLVLTELPTGIVSSGSNTVTVYPNGASGTFVPTDTAGGGTQANITPNGSGTLIPTQSSSGNWVYTNSFSSSNNISVTSNNTGNSGTPTPIGHIAATKTTNYIVKVIPDSNSDTASGVTSLAGMTGDIACGSNMLCTGNVVNAIIPSSSSINFTGFEAAASRTVQSKLQDVFSVLDYVGNTGCVADATSDCSAAFNAAVQAAYNYSTSNINNFVAGTVYVPAGPNCYRIHSSTIHLLKNVSLKGAGEATCIMADDVDAVTLNYVSGFGMPTISDMVILGNNATAGRTAIKLPGDGTNSNASLYGLTVRNVMIFQFDTGISMMNALTNWITNVWVQSVNQCINIVGWTGITKIQGLECVRAGGYTGTAPNSGLTMLPFTYTDAGYLSPEGTEIQESQFIGFNTAVDVQAAGFITITNSDLSGLVDGIKIAQTYGGVTVNNNYVALTGTAGAHGIYVTGNNANPSNIINLHDNSIIQTGSASATGIQVNDIGATTLGNVHVRHNLIDQMTAHDILVYNAAWAYVDSNYARSTGTTDSINMASAAAGTSFITNNHTAKAIVTTGSDTALGSIRTAGNYIESLGAGARVPATWNVETGSTTANRLMIGGGGGSQPTALAAGTVNTVVHGNASGAPTMSAVANADLVNPSTTVNGQTCTLGSTCTVTAAASGSAGGDLTGTYPNPTLLATVLGTPGTFGSATSCVTITNNAKGLTTAISAATCTPTIGSVTGLGTGVATALGIAVGSAGAFTTFNGAHGTPSSIVLTNATGFPYATGGTGILPIANGGVDQASWTAYTATVTCTTPGTTVFTLNSSRYKQIGKTIFLEGDATVTTAGTGSGVITLSLPTTAAAFRYTGSGQEVALTGRMESALITASGTLVQINDLSGSPVAFANGARHVIGITYEVP